jgi:Leucine-rich repeat (LRR) protein
LYFLWLDNNTLAESIPTDLGSISSLQELYIANNRLRGSIPAELGNAQTLSRIDLQGNYLTGDIGLVIDLLPRSLELFVVGGNQLQGTIPTSVGSFSSLKAIDVGRNNMNGTIPSEFGNATSLEELRLGENNFEGTLPTSIASLPNLCKLSKYAPSLGIVIFNLTCLYGFLAVILHIYGNELSGSLVEFCNIWDNSFELKYFAANKCGEPEDILCPCCNACCSIDIFECREI